MFQGLVEVPDPGADTILDSVTSNDEVCGGSGNDNIITDDSRVDYVDCGNYASPTISGTDSDVADVDSTALGDPVSDIVTDCETVN